MNSDTRIRFVGLFGLGSVAVWLTLSLGSCLYLCLTSLHWPTVPVQVTLSGVNTGSSNLGNWWSPDVRYEYQLDGHVYRSSNVRYLMPVFYHREEATAVQAAYPLGTQTKAAYDPHNPERSVLEPGVPPNMWERALIPVFFWALTAYILYEIKHPARRVLLRSNPEEAG
jgi:hypothetical protein